MKPLSARPARPALAPLVAPLFLAVAACGAAAGPADERVAAGRKAFAAACASCHQVGPAARAAFGPPLNGLIGRRAGSAPDYRYSEAMKNARIVWTEQTLAAFIQDAQRSVPGTKMRFSSFGYSERRIAELVAYLASLPPGE